MARWRRSPCFLERREVWSAPVPELSRKVDATTSEHPLRGQEGRSLARGRCVAPNARTFGNGRVVTAVHSVRSAREAATARDGASRGRTRRRHRACPPGDSGRVRRPFLRGPTGAGLVGHHFLRHRGALHIAGPSPGSSSGWRRRPAHRGPAPNSGPARPGRACSAGSAWEKTAELATGRPARSAKRLVRRATGAVGAGGLGMEDRPSVPDETPGPVQDFDREIESLAVTARRSLPSAGDRGVSRGAACPAAPSGLSVGRRCLGRHCWTDACATCARHSTSAQGPGQPVRPRRD